MNINFEGPPSDSLGLPLGWFELPDIIAYQKLINSIPDGSVIVEIGAWQGRSLCSIAEQIIAKRLQVYAVDTFEGTPGIKVVHNCNGKLQEIFEENVANFGLQKQLTVLRGKSTWVAKNFQEKVFLAFIDADHRPESVRADIRAWWPHIVNGGILCGHDFKTVGKTVKKIFKTGLKHDAEVWWVSKPLSAAR